MTHPSTTPEQQHLAKLAHDPKYEREVKAKYAHQHKQGDTELSGQPANVTPIVEALNSSSTGDSIFNSLWVVPIMIVLFFVCILLTNLVFGL